MMLHSLRVTDQYLVDTYETYDRVPGRYWPSDASALVTLEHGPHIVGECVRKVWYRHTRTPVTDAPDAVVIRKQMVGHLIEAQERVWLRRSHQLLDEHVSVEGRHPSDPTLIIAGELDAVLCGTPPVIVEIKTSHGYSFERDVLNGEHARPYPGHLLQGMVYLDLYPAASEVLFLYIDRGTLHRREHRLSLSSDGYASVNGHLDRGFSLSAIYRRMLDLHASIQSGRVPRPDYVPIYDASILAQRHSQGHISAAQVKKWHSGERFGDWQCVSCPFKSRCLDE